MKKSPPRCAKNAAVSRTGLTHNGKSVDTPRASESGLGPIFCAAYKKAGFKNPQRMLDDREYCLRQEKLYPDKIFAAIDIVGTMMSDILAQVKSSKRTLENKGGKRNGTSPKRQSH